MKQTTRFLNEAKQIKGIESDYALAKMIGITKSAISNYRNGTSKMDDYSAAQIAEIIGIKPIEVIATIHAEREKNEKKKKYWENLIEREKNK